MITYLYKLITTLRNQLYDKGFFATYESELPVICIGNLTAGGNGKTPLVLHTAAALKTKDWSPVILSRGYGGKYKGPLLVTEGHSATEVGDEPLMISRKNICPVVIARKRIEGAKFIESNKLGNLIILDDGYQHRALARAINIVCAYVGNEKSFKAFKQGRLLPFGRFRENKHQGLLRADALIFNSRSFKIIEDSDLTVLSADIPAAVKVFKSNLISQGIYSEKFKKFQDFKGQDCFAFCGIAGPESFESSLKSLGVNIVDSCYFSDHYSFSAKDIDKLVIKAAGKPLICSEKDLTKFNAQDYPSVYILKTALQIHPEQEFISFLESKLLKKCNCL